MSRNMGDLLPPTAGESLDEKLLALTVILESLCSSHKLQQLLYSSFHVELLWVTTVGDNGGQQRWATTVGNKGGQQRWATMVGDDGG